MTSEMHVLYAGLGETSLNWFNELTEICLADQQKRPNGGSATPVNELLDWSPCPRGGLFTLPGLCLISSAVQLDS